MVPSINSHLKQRTTAGCKGCMEAAIGKRGYGRTERPGAAHTVFPANMSSCVPWANLSVHHLQLRGPATRDAAPTWLNDMRRWRTGCLKELRLNGTAFDTLSWARTAYVQPLAMPFDRFMYNGSAHTYTVQKYLSSLHAQYGGIDSVRDSNASPFVIL